MEETWSKAIEEVTIFLSLIFRHTAATPTKVTADWPHGQLSPIVEQLTEYCQSRKSDKRVCRLV